MSARHGASDARSRVDDGGRRYRPRRMVARRASCITAFGNELELVVLEGSVIAPEAARKEPGLAWLETDGHPRLSVDESRLLEEAVDGLRIGCWPYRAPVGRWNEAAKLYPWLALTVRDESDGRSYEVDARRLSTAPRHLVPKLHDGPCPVRRFPAVDLLRARLGGVGELFIDVRHALRLFVIGLMLAACAYYAVGTAAWLWQLRDGMTGTELHGGVALMLAAIVCLAIAEISRATVSRRRRALSESVGGTATRACIRLCRVGIMLQLSALLGFLVW